MSHFTYSVLSTIVENIRQNPDRNAFFIEGEYYSYSCLGKAISKIRQAIRDMSGAGTMHVGLVTNNDLDTYASIIALWLEGKSYVPLNILWPIDRCLDIVEQVGIDLILDSSNSSRYNSLNVICTSMLKDTEEDLEFCETPDEGVAYILFTSGSTGRPKGVPISRGNLAAYCKAFDELEIKIGKDDRCLQCFDLTFDLSVGS